MGVKVIKRVYKNQFHPASKDTDWLLGNVGDWQRLEITFEAIVEYNATSTEPITVDSKNNSFILNNGKNWQDYGFDIGDSVTFLYTLAEDPDNDGVFDETFFSISFDVQNITKEVMEASQNINLDPYSIIPTDRGNVIIKDVRFVSEKEPEGLKFKFSLLPNANYNSGNLASFIDGTVAEFSFAGLSTLGIGQEKKMNPDGLQSGMAIESAFITKDVETTNPDPPARLEGLFGGTNRIVCGRLSSSVSSPVGSFSIPMDVLAPGDYITPQTGLLLPVISSTTGQYASLPNGGPAFIDKALTSGLRRFHYNVSLNMIFATAYTTLNNVSLVMHRYTGGASYNYAETILLEDNGDVGPLLGLSGVGGSGNIDLSVQVGDSYVLALQYTHPVIAFFTTVLDFSVFVSRMFEYSNVSPTEAFTYKISANFMIHSLFETPSNLETNTPPSILFNAGSLTDNFEIRVFPEWNNPNTVIKNDLAQTERLGNTGWFNENFNGLDNNFTIKSLRYLNLLGDVVNQLDYAQEIDVEIEIDGIENLSSDSEFSVGFAWIPQDEEDYKEKTTPFHHNLLINTGRTAASIVSDTLSFNLSEATGGELFSGYSNGPAKMNLMSTSTKMVTGSGSKSAIVKARFKPNGAFTSLFDSKSEDDRNYIIWVSAADHDLAINFSDRVSLLVDYNSLIKVVPPVGPYPGMTNKFIEHPQDANVSGVQKYYGFVEDDVLKRVEFTVKKSDDVFIQNMVFGYEVLNKITGTRYKLEDISVNLSEFPKNKDNEQEIAFDSTRGFRLVDGNNKNWVKVERNKDKDTDEIVAYVAYFASKIRWEDWISRDDALAEYFDTSLESNGQSNDWISYLRAGLPDEHEINFFVYTDVTQVGEFKRYDNYFEITFNDYDENANITTDHSYYRDSTNDLLNIGTDPETGKPLGVLLDNEPTRIEITYTNLTEDFDIGKMYATITLEIDRGAGSLELRQLSSVWDSEPDNPLIPLAGETKLKFESLASNVVKASCLVDPNKLERVLRYKVSGRIGCWPEGVSSVPDGTYEPAYEISYE